MVEWCLRVGASALGYHTILLHFSSQGMEEIIKETTKTSLFMRIPSHLCSPCISDNKPTTLPSFEMRKMLQDYKSQAYNLIMELKEKHRLERRYILRTMKSSRKFQYEQREIVSANSQRTSYEEEDLTTGLVALPAWRRALILNEHEDQQESPNYNLVRVSFHIPNEASKEETKP